MPQSDRTGNGGWGEAARRVAGSLLDIGHARIELAAVELAQERLRIAQIFVTATATLFLLGLGLMLLTAWVLVWCEPAQRVTALGGMAALLLAIAAAGAWRWRSLSRNAPPLLQATLAELERDRQAWTRPATQR